MQKVSADCAELVLQGLLLGCLPYLWGQHPIPLEVIPRTGRRLLKPNTPIQMKSLGVPVVQQLKDVWKEPECVAQMA